MRRITRGKATMVMRRVMRATATTAMKEATMATMQVTAIVMGMLMETLDMMPESTRSPSFEKVQRVPKSQPCRRSHALNFL